MRDQRFSLGRAITPHDSTNIVHPVGRDVTDAVWVGGAGVVVVVWPDSTTSAITVVAGTLLPFAVKRINSTSTTATLIVALYNL